jgi:uncharacterized protein (TIGR02186 family)
VIGRAVLFLLVTAATAGSAAAERLTIALSTTDIAISSSFTGVPLTVFGVIEGDRASAPPGRNYRVAVLVLGPRYSVVARKKDRVLGIWANRESQTIINPPSFYSLATSAPLADLAAPSVLERLQLGLDNIAFVYEARAVVNDPGAAEFRDAFIRLKEKSRLYGESVGGVNFIGDVVFRTTAFLPANIPVGDYTAVAYLFSGSELIARAEQKIGVSRTGFEATMAGFARTQSLPYGVLVVAMALFIGWLGGVIFRRD